jgi:hypothetical protein
MYNGPTGFPVSLEVMINEAPAPIPERAERSLIFNLTPCPAVASASSSVSSPQIFGSIQ